MSSPDTTYDVIVIGGGSAGTAAASAASAAGARTALVNDGELGGLCILRGCMPTKTMLHSAHVLHEMSTSAPLGVHAGETGFDFAAIMRRKDEKVARFKRAKIRSIERGDYEVLDARGSFLDAETVSVGGRPYRAKGYVIATGSVPSPPHVGDMEDVAFLTSDHVMRMKSLPGSMVVQGAGAIGLELGQFFARLGVEVLLVNRSAPLFRIDGDLSDEMMRMLRDEPNLRTCVPATIDRARGGGEAIRFRISGAEGAVEHRAEAFLAATGRVAALEGLGLEAAGVNVEGHRILHEATMQTSNPRVFVAGDATGGHQILHLANQEGSVAGHNAALERCDRSMDYRLRMAAIFTDPPFACVGLPEDEARRSGADVICAVKRFPEQGRAITMEARHGLLKVVAEASSGEILGAQILGPRADDVIHVLSGIMYYRGTAADITRMPWYHPTISEALIEVGRELATACTGKPLMQPPPA